MKNTINKLLAAACACLLIAAAIFIGVKLGDRSADSWLLGAALGCILLSGLFNIIRTRLK